MNARWLRNRFVHLITLCMTLCGTPVALAQFAPATDSSDLWWNPNESGWGMQIVEEGDASFATLFVYDSTGAPTFLTATLSLAGSASWSGDLYRTTGPYLGAASFNPTLVTGRKVGALTFARTNSDSATLNYSVDGVGVSKAVTRQLLRYDNYSGTYRATVSVVASHCSSSTGSAPADAYIITIAQSGNAMTLSGDFAHRSACTYSGTYLQAGRVGSLGATYTCADGDKGNMNFFDLTRRPGMVFGRFSGHSDSDSCDYTGTFAGLIPM